MSLLRDNTERVGMNAVEAIFLGFKWTFRGQPVSDYGIDAQVEIWEDGEFTGKLIALQIKSGESYFIRRKGEDYIFASDLKHLDYWVRQPIPVFVILHNPANGLTLWQKIDKRLTVETASGFTIVIPSTNVLDERSKAFLSEGIASDPEFVRRFNLAFDFPMMQRLIDKEEVYFEVNEWVNKTLNMRDIGVYFDEIGGNREPEFMIRVWTPARGISEFVNDHYPWLDHELIETNEALGGEVEVHTLHVWVNELGKQYIALEEFYANGLPERDEHEALDDDIGYED